MIKCGIYCLQTSADNKGIRGWQSVFAASSWPLFLSHASSGHVCSKRVLEAMFLRDMSPQGMSVQGTSLQVISSCSRAQDAICSYQAKPAAPFFPRLSLSEPALPVPFSRPHYTQEMLTDTSGMRACHKQASSSAAAELLQSCGWWRPHEQLGLIKADRAELFPAAVQVCSPPPAYASCKAAECAVAVSNTCVVSKPAYETCCCQATR